MGDILPTGIVLFLGAIAALAWARQFPRREATLIMVSFGLHFLATLAQVWITLDYYGYGDMWGYYRVGIHLAELIRFDPGTFLPDVASIVFHGEPILPVRVDGIGGPTGVPPAISGILLVFLNDSLYALCLVLAVATFFSKGALYRVLRDVFPEEVRIRVLVACMLMPSVIFWSCGVLKEAIAMTGFGWVVFGWHRFLLGRRFTGVLITLVASVPVGIVKPYILLALAIALGVWWYWRRASEAAGGEAVLVKPIYFVVGSAAVLGAIVLLGDMFPRYALDNLSEETARLQGIGVIQHGGSDYEIGDSTQRSALGQIAFAPLGLLTALFRPFIFEVKNPLMVLNALETTVLTIVFIRAVIRRSWAEIWRETRRSPPLVFALTFTLVFGVAVGLATTNLGTLSRYRIPLVPLFASFILVLSSPRTRSATVPTSEQAQASTGAG